VSVPGDVDWLKESTEAHVAFIALPRWRWLARRRAANRWLRAVAQLESEEIEAARARRSRRLLDEICHHQPQCETYSQHRERLS
jgi:hypothetical protein